MARERTQGDLVGVAGRVAVDEGPRGRRRGGSRTFRRCCGSARARRGAVGGAGVPSKLMGPGVALASQLRVPVLAFCSGPAWADGAWS